jgi:hypothetical protein
LKHDGVCTVKTVGGCRLCARITNLLNIHARACRIENCKVPHCLELREQMRYAFGLGLRSFYEPVLTISRFVSSFLCTEN